MKRIICFLVIITTVTSINGQTLEGYKQEALENNPQVNGAYLTFEAALTRVSQENALPDPVVSFGYFISPIETRVGAQQAKISLVQMFPWFGTLKTKEQGASYAAEARFHEFIDIKNKVEYQVEATYFPLMEINEHIRLQSKNLELLKSYKQLATTSYANGKSSMTDVLRVDIMIDELETEIEILKKKIYPLQVSFNRTLNRPDSMLINVSDSFDQMVMELYEINRDSLVASNPTINSINSEIKSMEARELLARKNGLPKIGVGLDYAFINERTDIDVPNNGQNAFMPMISMTVPIFRSKNNSEIEESRILQSALNYQKKYAENKLVSDYENSLFEVERTYKLYNLYNDQISTTSHVLSLLYTEYSNSGSDFEEVLRMQQKLLAYEMAKVSAFTNYSISIANWKYIISKTGEYGND